MIRLIFLSFVTGLAFSFQVHAQSCVVPQLDKATLSYTGYKFTNKEGVTGTFKNISWQAPSNQSIDNVLKHAMISIDTGSIDAGDPARDENLLASLFKVLIDGHTIRAVGRSVDTQNKTLLVDLLMGGGVRPVLMKYTVINNTIELEGVVDLVKLGYTDAFEALSEQCKDLHTGIDNIVKSWSDVLIKIKVPFTGC